MIYGYEIIGKNKVNYAGDNINVTTKLLTIRTYNLNPFNYVTFLKRVDAIYGECLYLAFSQTPATDKSKRFNKTQYGYYNINIKDIFKELYIKDNCNVTLTEENDGNNSDVLILRLDINY